jgi:hypothetical protein
VKMSEKDRDDPLAGLLDMPDGCLALVVMIEVMFLAGLAYLLGLWLRGN